MHRAGQRGGKRWRSVDIGGVDFSCHHVGPRDGTQVVAGLGSKHLYTRSHLRKARPDFRGVTAPEPGLWQTGHGTVLGAESRALVDLEWSLCKAKP